MYKRKQIIIRIFQGLQKLKTKIKLKHIHNKDLLLLNFLWKNNIIYGYLKVSLLHFQQIIVFLKYNKVTSISPLFFVSKNINFRNLKEETRWAKNTFFILYTKSGFISNEGIKEQKIGGYFFGKFF